MRRTKQEIEGELDHKNKLVHTYRARLRPLELQAAQKGMYAPPEVLTEISALTEQIRAQEDEIATLESLAAEGQLSLSEAEYRVLLAEVWDTSIGRPSTSGAARLELTRLKLGLTPERAQELEKEVRIALVEEIFLTIDISPLLGQYPVLPQNITQVQLSINAEGEGSTTVVDTIQINQNLTISSPLESALHLIGKAVRLDLPTALRLFLQSLPLDTTLDIIVFRKQLITENRVWVTRDEYLIFDNFLMELTSEMNARVLPSPTVILDQEEKK